MARLKDLYMASSLEELEPYYALPDIKKKKIEMLLTTGQKLYQNADRYRLDGDEEKSYILYMKYFNLLDYIRNSSEYLKEKKKIIEMLGGRATANKAMDEVETLSKSLRQRYEFAAEMKKATETQLTTINNSSGDLNKSINILQMSVISCKELFQRIQDKSTSTLIMDCRSRYDYENSQLYYNWCLNVPEEVILPGMSAGKIQEQLDVNSRSFWSSRAIKDQIVLMDWNCNGPEPRLDTTIWRLRDILRNWDPDVNYRSPIKILQGGYEQFILMYPTQCTNPAVQAPESKKDEEKLFEEIEYPSFDDITMKEELISSPKSMLDSSSRMKPSIDRSSKSAALKVYSERKEVDIYKEREVLTEEAIEVDKRLLQAEKEWKTLITQKTDTNGEGKEILTREQELLYNILQLECTAGDYQAENERLRRELEEFKRKEKEISPKEAETIEEAKKKIEVNVMEHKQIEEKLDIEKQEREKQLAIARENKRHLKPPSIEDEEVSKPKIPQFDRTSKPLHVANNKQIIEVTTTERKVERDFSPLRGSPGRGLTGLKNLGNTCYMNSILQCLSNTSRLTEYLITNEYKKHVNRSNKTKGRICEEVAALIKVLWNGHYKCVASKDLRYVVGQYQQIFRGIEQQDSHEFLTILMDWMHSDLQTLQISDSPRDNLPPSEKAWLDFTKSRESLILRLFYGQIKSTVKCVECNKESATYESFSNLSLELPSNGNMCSLSDCMDMYFSGERIHGWICPNCKQQREAVKKLDISKLPPFLVVHMKRFFADPDFASHTYRKKQNYVRFPLDELDVKPYIAPSELMRSRAPKTYQLYAVSNHYGTMESGHYTAFCKSSTFNKWFKFDDQVVSHLDASNVVSSAAYILFYTSLPLTPPGDVI